MDVLDPDRIPPCVRNAIDQYQMHGLWPGDTTHRLLTGDVFGAFERADDETRAALPAVIAYIVKSVHPNARGSAARVSAWLNLRAASRSA